jgi:Zn-dependent membrane protease YugP
LQIRSAIVPAAQFGSTLAPWLFIGGLLLNLTPLAWAGVILFGAAVVFTLVTLPVEFDASRRAKKLLSSNGIMIGNEMEGVNKVLDAAAWTYVAAAVSAVGTFLYYIILLSGGRRR